MQHGLHFPLPALLLPTLLDWLDDHLMEARSNEDTHLHSPVPEAQTHNNLAAHCDDPHFSLPATPPPTYREAVQPDPFPVLTPPSVPSQDSVAALPSPPTQSWGEPLSYEDSRLQATAPPFNGVFTPNDAAFYITPPPTYENAVSETTSVSCVRTQPVSVNRSQSATILLTSLREVSGMVRCPYCDYVGVTLLSYEPGALTFGICILLGIFGGFCFGYCLIPFAISSLKDVRHSCPRCERHLHTFIRGRCHRSQSSSGPQV